MLGKVWPGAVIGHDFTSSVSCHLRVPPLLSFRKALVEVGEALLKVRSVARVQFAELSRNALGHAPAIVRVEPVMRIAQRMHIAFSARDFALRNLKNFRKLRGVEIPISSGLDASIAGLCDQRRQPAYLQIETYTDE